MTKRERNRPVLRGGVASICPHFLLWGLIFLTGLLLPASSAAQRQSGAAGMGGQVGHPGGLALKLYRPGPIAYDAVISTDGDDFVVGHAHRLWERPLPDSPLHLYVGPGVGLGLDHLAQSPHLRLGLSAEAGLNFYAEQFEVFLHVTPALRFLPDARMNLDGNVGLRYYFRFP